MNKYFPILLIAGSNVVYHISTKSIPEKLNPFASLTITYTAAAFLSFFAFFITKRTGPSALIQEYSYANFSSFLIGASVIGIDVGNRLLYKLGWNINSGYIVQSILVSSVLLIVGALLYKEAITSSKLLGILFCMIGILFINR